MKIPIPFKGVIGVAKISVEMAIIMTCFTLPAIVRVNGEVNLFVIRLVTLRELKKGGKGARII
jgi:hypothetical protein